MKTVLVALCLLSIALVPAVTATGEQSTTTCDPSNVIQYAICSVTSAVHGCPPFPANPTVFDIAFWVLETAACIG